MIVVSFALVVVAFVLLIIGLVVQAVLPVYLCILTAIVAGVFLAIGVFRRRNDDTADAVPASAPAGPAAPSVAGSDAAPTTALAVTAPAPDEEDLEVDDEVDEVAEHEQEWDDEEFEYGGTVFIIEGRPRYHTEDCRYVRDRDDVEAIDVLDAREEGFTNCGVCRPDEVLEEMKAELEAQEAGVAPEGLGDVEQFDDEEYDDDVEDLDPAPVVPAPVADEYDDEDELDDHEYEDEPAAVAVTAPAAEPARKRAAKKAAAAASSPQGALAEATASRGAVPRGAVAGPTAGAPAKAASSAPRVVVIPDRDKFHRDNCRYVRDNPDSTQLTKATARRRGYIACGLCKP